MAFALSVIRGASANSRRGGRHFTFFVIHFFAIISLCFASRQTDDEKMNGKKRKCNTSYTESARQSKVA